MPYRFMQCCIVARVDPDLLIKRLVMRAGGSLPVARAMGMPSFQGTLNKLMNGRVKSPQRSTAERIARHFRFPVEAVYDPDLAEKVAAELGVADSSGPARGQREDARSPAQTAEPPARYNVTSNDMTMAEAVTQLARSVAAMSRIDRAQLQPLLSLLTSEPEARNEISTRILGLLAPQLDFTYQYTWEDMARMVAAKTGKARMTGEEFVALVDESHGKHVHLQSVAPSTRHG